MNIVKISQPSSWENKINFSSPENLGVWDEFRFVLTKRKIECDYWIVFGDIDDNEEAICPKENVIYITDEAHEEKKYSQRFLNQFSAIITSRRDILHNNLIFAPYICGWFIKKNYDFLKALEIDKSNKSKTISAVSSNLTWLDGHKKRFAFINRMIGHFKGRLDVYGRGFNPIEDKYDALIDYQYSIAIENSRFPGYFSEKLTDCFLTYTMPIYFGCSDVTSFFPKESILLIDIDNYLESIDIIEECIHKSYFNNNFDAIVEARSIYFAKYHPLQAIALILRNHFNSESIKRNNKLSSAYNLQKEKNRKLLNSLLFNGRG